MAVSAAVAQVRWGAGVQRNVIEPGCAAWAGRGLREEPDHCRRRLTAHRSFGRVGQREVIAVVGRVLGYHGDSHRNPLGRELEAQLGPMTIAGVDKQHRGVERVRELDAEGGRRDRAKTEVQE